MSAPMAMLNATGLNDDERGDRCEVYQEYLLAQIQRLPAAVYRHALSPGEVLAQVVGVPVVEFEHGSDPVGGASGLAWQITNPTGPHETAGLWTLVFYAVNSDQTRYDQTWNTPHIDLVGNRAALLTRALSDTTDLHGPYSNVLDACEAVLADCPLSQCGSWWFEDPNAPDGGFALAQDDRSAEWTAECQACDEDGGLCRRHEDAAYDEQERGGENRPGLILHIVPGEEPDLSDTARQTRHFLCEHIRTVAALLAANDHNGQAVDSQAALTVLALKDPVRTQAVRYLMRGRLPHRHTTSR